MQNFRKITDGVTYEQVFTGQGAYYTSSGAYTVSASGTVGVALRKYSEGAGYTLTPYPQSGNYYFQSDWKLVPNTGGADYSAIHWNLKPGQSITYWITPGVKDFDAKFPKAKIIDAVKEGVTNWNAVFGWEALKVKMADDYSVVGQDDKNVIEIDQDPSAGYAFANWRTNPNTGEIRGATVYLGGVWFESNPFAPRTTTTTSGSGDLVNLGKPQARPTAPELSWSPMSIKPACIMWAPSFREGGDDKADAATGTTTATADPDAQFHAYIAHVVLHEVGHTLGLRHNFKGSLTPPSTSVMDYLNDADSTQMAHPGAYDAEAIKFLYGLATAEPADQDFCTDGDVRVDPACATFDHGANPLHDSWGQSYSKFIPVIFKYGWNDPRLELAGYYGYADYLLDAVLEFARAGASDDVDLDAYNLAMALSKNLTPDQAANAMYASSADGLAARVMSRLYLDDDAARGYIANDPWSPAVTEAALADLSAFLDNADGVRSFASRRVFVDVLKHMQSDEAYAALRAARSSIAAARAAMTGDDANNTDDLLARIDQATSPYYVH
jgi:hypothetical protein